MCALHCSLKALHLNTHLIFPPKCQQKLCNLHRTQFNFKTKSFKYFIQFTYITYYYIVLRRIPFFIVFFVEWKKIELTTRNPIFIHSFRNFEVEWYKSAGVKTLIKFIVKFLLAKHFSCCCRCCYPAFYFIPHR